MGIYSDSIILGVRVLIELPINNGEYYVKYEFTDEDWANSAIRVLPLYIGKIDVKIQTLHPFSTSYNLVSGQSIKSGNVWLDNNYLKLEDLFKY